MMREGLTFDDVLLEPQHSTVASRSQIDLSVKLDTLFFRHPIVPANMKTVVGPEMAFSIIHSGGLAILHRFMPIEEQLQAAQEIEEGIGSKRFAVSIGVKPEELDNIAKFWKIGIRTFCIDIAHGDSRLCLEMISSFRKKFPEALLIAGNVATGTAARRLWQAGADVIKVGVGPGSLCSTRIETGNGVPQLTAIMDVYQAKQDLLALDRTRGGGQNRTGYAFIADGGVKNAGDCVKALCFADMVMAGNLFAGCSEAPGKTVVIDGRPYKEYVGSSTHKTNHIEGVEAWVPRTGSYQDLLTKLLEGIRSGCSYQGCQNLSQLKDNPTFIRITNAGMRESHPHDVLLK